MSNFVQKWTHRRVRTWQLTVEAASALFCLNSRVSKAYDTASRIVWKIVRVNLTIPSFTFVRISPSQLIKPVKAFLKLSTLKELPILKKKKTASIQTIKPPKTKNYDFVNLLGVNTSFALKWTSKRHSRQVHQQCLQNNSLKCRFWLNIGGVGVGLSHGPSRIRVSWLGDNLKGFSPWNSARTERTICWQPNSKVATTKIVDFRDFFHIRVTWLPSASKVVQNLT